MNPAKKHPACQNAKISGDNLRAMNGFSPEAVVYIRVHARSGNLRELRNAIERVVVLVKHEELLLKDFRTELRGQNTTTANGGNVPQIGR
jgi:DNA-binding NtrC family response regulator